MSKGLLLLAAVVLMAVAVQGAKVVDLNDANFDAIVKDPTKTVFVKFYATWCGHCKRLEPTWEQLAEKFAGQDDVVIARVDVPTFESLGSEYGIRGFPTLKVFGKNNKAPENYQGARTLDAFAEFVEKANGKAAEPKAEAPAADKAATGAAAGTGKVVELTDANFNQIVKDSGKTVFVKFYAPWCGHCKRLVPVWDQLAAKFAGRDDVVIAKLDSEKYMSTANPFGIEGYPTLKVFGKANKAKGTEYEGGRSVDALAAFVEKNL